MLFHKHYKSWILFGKRDQFGTPEHYRPSNTIFDWLTSWNVNLLSQLGKIKAGIYIAIVFKVRSWKLLNYVISQINIKIKKTKYCFWNEDIGLKTSKKVGIHIAIAESVNRKDYV